MKSALKDTKYHDPSTGRELQVISGRKPQDGEIHVDQLPDGGNVLVNGVPLAVDRAALRGRAGQAAFSASELRQRLDDQQLATVAGMLAGRMGEFKPGSDYRQQVADLWFMVHRDATVDELAAHPQLFGSAAMSSWAVRHPDGFTKLANRAAALLDSRPRSQQGGAQFEAASRALAALSRNGQLPRPAAERLVARAPNLLDVADLVHLPDDLQVRWCIRTLESTVGNNAFCARIGDRLVELARGGALPKGFAGAATPNREVTAFNRDELERARIAAMSPDEQFEAVTTGTPRKSFLSSIETTQLVPRQSPYLSAVVDQQVLLRLAEEGPAELRPEAVRRLDDQGQLARFALGDDDPATRAAAVSRVRDQQVLAEVARRPGEEFKIRESAVGRLGPTGKIELVADFWDSENSFWPADGSPLIVGADDEVDDFAYLADIAGEALNGAMLAKGTPYASPKGKLYALEDRSDLWEQLPAETRLPVLRELFRSDREAKVREAARTLLVALGHGDAVGA